GSQAGSGQTPQANRSAESRRRRLYRDRSTESFEANRGAEGEDQDDCRRFPGGNASTLPGRRWLWRSRRYAGDAKKDGRVAKSNDGTSHRDSYGLPEAGLERPDRSAV